MIKEIINEIKKHENIVLFHHIMIDGDSLSSSYGLMKALQKKFPQKNIKWVPEIDKIDKRFNYLNIDFNDAIYDIDDSFLAIVGDVTGEDRVYKGELLQKAKKSICFDHHHFDETKTKYDIHWHEPKWPASAIQAIKIVEALDVEITEDIALLMVYGVLTDTGRFAYSLSDPLPLETAKNMFKYISNNRLQELYLNMNITKINVKRFQGHVLSNFKTKGEIAYFIVDKEVQKKFSLDPDETARVNYLSNLENIKIWMFFIEYDDFIRVEFRSTGISVNKIASHFGGGGHIKAAGTRIKSIDEVQSVIDYSYNFIKKNFVNTIF